jgi:hypothetical protein
MTAITRPDIPARLPASHTKPVLLAVRARKAAA